MSLYRKIAGRPGSLLRIWLSRPAIHLFSYLGIAEFISKNSRLARRNSRGKGRCMHPAEHASLGTTLRAAEHLWLPGGPCADIVKLGFDPDCINGRPRTFRRPSAMHYRSLHCRRIIASFTFLKTSQFQAASGYASQEFTLPS